jgi:hypothetical protein
MKTLLLSLSLMLVAFGNAGIQPGGRWKVVGRKVVDYRPEIDIIPVTAFKGSFKKLKLFVRGGDVHFRDMKIFYRNGEVQDVPLRMIIPAGGESRVIDLNGRERIITRIQLIYDTTNRSKVKARVVVMAKE